MWRRFCFFVLSAGGNICLHNFFMQLKNCFSVYIPPSDFVPQSSSYLSNSKEMNCVVWHHKNYYLCIQSNSCRQCCQMSCQLILALCYSFIQMQTKQKKIPSSFSTLQRAHPEHRGRNCSTCMVRAGLLRTVCRSNLHKHWKKAVISLGPVGMDPMTLCIK